MANISKPARFFILKDLSLTQERQPITGGLLYGTKLTMADDSTKNIHDIVPGDILWSKSLGIDGAYTTYPELEALKVNSVKGTETFAKVVSISSFESQGFVEFNNGKLCVGLEHRMLVKREDGFWHFIPAPVVKPGDIMVGQAGQEVPVTSVKMTIRPQVMFNIDVAAPNMFFADGILVHDHGVDIA